MNIIFCYLVISILAAVFYVNRREIILRVPTGQQPEGPYPLRGSNPNSKPTASTSKPVTSISKPTASTSKPVASNSNASKPSGTSSNSNDKKAETAAIAAGAAIGGVAVASGGYGLYANGAVNAVRAAAVANAPIRVVNTPAGPKMVGVPNSAAQSQSAKAEAQKYYSDALKRFYGSGAGLGKNSPWAK